MATTVDEIVLKDATTSYVEYGGYKALEKARAMTPEQITDELLASELRGRGGAFFATGRKWSFVPSKEQIAKPHYLVVNADESEPGSFKDNEILSRVPHRFIEGCLITARAIDCTHVFVYIRGEYSGPYEILVNALQEVPQDVFGGITIVVHRGAGAYICGEETALIESLEGKRGQPRSKPPFPAISGLYASPTVVNNVETITTVAPILAMGGAEYAKLGVPNTRGTRVVSISGNVVNGGNYEIEPGTTLRDLIYGPGGGIADGRELKAVVPGGSSTVILTSDEIDVGYDFDSLAQHRTAMGSAGIVVLDDRCCIVQLGIRFAEFYEHESCGKCTPCREGTRWLTKIVRKIEDGRGEQSDLDLLLDVCDNIAPGLSWPPRQTTICPLGPSIPSSIVSAVRMFRDEFLLHIKEGACPYGH